MGGFRFFNVVSSLLVLSILCRLSFANSEASFLPISDTFLNDKCWYANAPGLPQGGMMFTTLIGDLFLAPGLLDPQGSAINLATGEISIPHPKLFRCEPANETLNWCVIGTGQNASIGLVDNEYNITSRYLNANAQLWQDLTVLSENSCIVHGEGTAVEVVAGQTNFKTWSLGKSGVFQISTLDSNRLAVLFVTPKDNPSHVYSVMENFESTPKVYEFDKFTPEQILVVDGQPFVLGISQNSHTLHLTKPDEVSRTAKNVEIPTNPIFIYNLIECNGLFLYNQGEIIHFDQDLNAIWAKTFSFSAASDLADAVFQCTKEQKLVVGINLSPSAFVSVNQVLVFDISDSSFTISNTEYGLVIKDKEIPKLKHSTEKLKEYHGLEFNIKSTIFTMTEPDESMTFKKTGELTPLKYSSQNSLGIWMCEIFTKF